MQEVISYSFSRTKIITPFILVTLLMLLSLSLSVLCIFESIFVVAIPISIFFILLLSFWLDICKILWKCLRGLPAFQLTPQALIDNTNNISFAWKDIRAFNEASLSMGNGGVVRKEVPYISISLYNEAFYLSQLPGWRKRLIAGLNSRYFGGAFSIQTNALKESRLVVLESLNDYKDRYSYSKVSNQ